MVIIEIAIEVKLLVLPHKIETNVLNGLLAYNIPSSFAIHGLFWLSSFRIISFTLMFGCKTVMAAVRRCLAVNTRVINKDPWCGRITFYQRKTPC